MKKVAVATLRAMPDYRRAHCLIRRGGCGKTSVEVGPISWGGLCGSCGPKVFHKACDDMHFHAGPTFEVWRRAMVACVGGVLLDDTPPTA